jgi:predicted nucleotidyltransferase
MLTGKELRIIGLYRNNIFKRYTIREIMKSIGTSSYNWVHTIVKELIIQSILTAEKKGNSTICSINLDSQTAISYLSYFEEMLAVKAAIPNIDKTLRMIEPNYFTLLVAGSYAKGKATRESDVDIVVIMHKQEEVKPLLNRLKREGELMTPELHPYVFTDEEFHIMLINKEWNYGKEIFLNHLIIHGAEGYYNIINKAVQNGFKG